MCPTRGPMARGAREDILDIPGNLAQVRISQNSSKFAVQVEICAHVPFCKAFAHSARQLSHGFSHGKR